MKRKLRITTGILTTVLLGSIATNFIASELNDVKEFGVVQSSNISEVDEHNIEIIDDSQSFYSDANQAAIASDLETHVAGGMDDPYNLVFTIENPNDYLMFSDMYYYNKSELEVVDAGAVETDSITPDSLRAELGINEDTTIPEYLNIISTFYANKDNWFALYGEDLFHSEYDYNLGFDFSVNYLEMIDPSNPDSSLDFTGSQFSMPYYDTADGTWQRTTKWGTTSPNSDSDSALFLDHIWLGKEGHFIVDTALTDYEEYMPMTTPYTPMGDSFTPYFDNGTMSDSILGVTNIDYGFAKLIQTDDAGNSKEIYADISIAIDLESGLRSFDYTIEDLPAGYKYELEDVYVAYSTMNSVSSSVSSIDGSDTYAYATLKGRAEQTDGTTTGVGSSYNPVDYDGEKLIYNDSPIIFQTTNEDQTLVEYNEENENKLIDAITSALTTMVITDATTKIEETKVYLNGVYNDIVDSLDGMFIPPHITEDNNFQIIDYGNDYVVFGVDVFEGQTYGEIHNHAIKNDNRMNVHYSPDNLTIFADLKDSTISDEWTVHQELEFTDNTWNDGGYVNPGSEASRFIKGIDTDATDGDRTHIYTLSGIKSDTSVTPFVGATQFDNLEFVFAGGNPYNDYSSNYTDLDLLGIIDVLGVDKVDNTVNELSETYMYYLYENMTFANMLSSIDDEPLFETSLYTRPLLLSTFTWHTIEYDTAQFSISYRTNIEDSEKYLDFDPEDVVLLWNSNDTKNSKASIQPQDVEYSDFSLDESYEIADENVHNPGHLKFIGTSETKMPRDSNIETLTYEVSGLKSFTEYSDFGIYIKSPDSKWAINDWSESGDGDMLIPASDQGLYYVPLRFELYTPHAPGYYVKVIVVLAAILLILIAMIFVWWFFIWWKNHMALSIYYDGELSFERKELIFKLLHANRTPKIWDAHEEDLILIASGKVLDAEFRKSTGVNGGYTISIKEDTSKKINTLSILSASKYNKYYIGVRGISDQFHSQVISDHKAKKVLELTKVDEFELYEMSKESLQKEVSSRTDIKISKREKEMKIGHIVSSVSDSKTTATTIRYQILLPENHELENVIDKEDSPVRFYHLYNGRLYNLDYKFISKHGTMYEYDIIGLQPGTVYVGLTLSLNEGEKIYPSASLFGMTKSLDGMHLNKTDAILGKPSDVKNPSIPMWTETEMLTHLTKQQVKRSYELIIKKHYEDDNKDDYLHAKAIDQFYDDYIGKWYTQINDAEVEAKMKALAERTKEIDLEMAKKQSKKTTTKEK